MLRWFAFLVLSTCLGLTGWAATYYVDDLSGSDANSGLSPASAWRSVARVNAGSYQAGDRVLFRRGGLWREELSNNTGLLLVTHGAYGAGPDPAIFGSEPYPAGQFSLVSGTIHAVSHADSQGILSLLASPGAHGVWWIDDQGHTTSLARSVGAAPASGEWFHAAGTLYVNLGGPLSGRFEVCARDKCVEVWTGTRFENLVFRHGLDGNFNLGCSNFRFEACEFAFNAANGINTGSNGSVGPGYFSRCRIRNNGGHGIHHHYTSETGFMHVEYCWISDNGGHGIFEDTYNNVDYGADWVINCTITGNGGWGVYVENLNRAEYLRVANTICVGNASGEFHAPDNANMHILAASNCVGPAGVYGGKWAQPAYRASDLALDPVFLEAAYATISGVWKVGDARLAPNSPCIDAGSATGLALDLAGRLVPQGAGVDLGAFEFLPLALARDELDARLDEDAVRVVSDSTSGLALYARQTDSELYLAIQDASGAIAPTDLVYILFARQGVESRFTLPDEPSNPDYATLSGSGVLSVRPWDELGQGGGYLRFNDQDSPASAWIGNATGMLGASLGMGVVEILLDRALNQLSTSSSFAWVVVVDASLPGQIKIALPGEAPPPDQKINGLDELLRLDGIVVESAIPFWRALR